MVMSHRPVFGILSRIHHLGNGGTPTILALRKAVAGNFLTPLVVGIIELVTMSKYSSMPDGRAFCPIMYGAIGCNKVIFGFPAFLCRLPVSILLLSATVA